MANTNLLDQHARAIDELIALEERAVVQELPPGERARWRELCAQLFGEAPSAEDRRRFVRVRTQRMAHIVGPALDERVEVTSLSAGGLFLHSERARPELIGRDLEIEIEFPSGAPEVVRCRAEVCWVASAGADRKAGMGLKFVDLTDDQRRCVLAHCRQHLLWLLELSEHKYHFFFEHSADVAILIDSQGVIREVSAQGARVLGRDAVALVGSRVKELLAPESRAQFDGALRTLPAELRARFPAHFCLPTGHTFAVDVQLVSLTVSGLAVGAILVAHDLDARLRVADQQRELERRLFQADKLATIGQIAASVAHDINNPLAYVHSNLTLLGDYIGPIRQMLRAGRALGAACPVEEATLARIEGDLDELVNDSLEGSRRIRDILLELRDFSGRDAETRVRIDVNRAIETSLRVLMNLIRHRARLVREFATDLAETYCNVARLSQILLNLLSNAAQAFATPALDRNVIRVRTAQVGDHIRVEVEDNGRGIHPDSLARIFEPFFTTRREEGGSGLGLVIAKENAEVLGGTLTVRSTLGKGTCFTVTLPVRRPSRPVPPPPDAVSLSAEASGRVLVIDDEPALLRSLGRLLGRAYQVTLTTSPRAALELIAQHSFDAIVSDVMVPEMSGLRFLEELRGAWPQLISRLIFITGGTFSADEETQLEQAGRPVLRKPIDAEALLRAIGQVMGRNPG